MTTQPEKTFVALGLVAALPVTFALVGQWASAQATGAPSWLPLPIDTTLPVVPGTVWAYLSWYPATAIPLFLDAMRFRWAYRAYALAFATCLLGYVLVPASISRPIIARGGNASTAALEALYALDPPVNLFPSFHAAVAMILAMVVPQTAGTQLLGAVWACAVMVACVLTKQHYVLDVLVGAGVGFAATELVRTRMRMTSERARVP